MHLHGTETLPGTPEDLWPILFDPEMIAATIPGCRSLHRLGPDRYAGLVDLRLGPFSQTFEARFTVLDQVRPERYRLEVEAHGRGLTVTASTHVGLEPGGEGGTLMRYESTVHLGGGLAGLGMLGEPLAKMLVAQGLSDLKQKIEARMRGGAGPGDATPGPPPG